MAETKALTLYHPAASTFLEGIREKATDIIKELTAKVTCKPHSLYGNTVKLDEHDIGDFAALDPKFVSRRREGFSHNDHAPGNWKSEGFMIGG